MKQEGHEAGSCGSLAGMAKSVATRRSFVRKGAAAFGGVALTSTAVSTFAAGPTDPNTHAAAVNQTGKHPLKSWSSLNLLRLPDAVTAYRTFEKTLPSGIIPLLREGKRWQRAGVAVESTIQPESIVFTLAAPSTPVAIVHVRWNARVNPDLLTLGDAWERSYGDLGWRKLIPEFVMPWYFATCDGRTCDSYGVRTDARALCFWQLDPQGVSLWLNVTNGGDGVELGQRQLTMATVVNQTGSDGEDPFVVISGLCRAMCARPSRPATPIYGANDWCYSYGRSTSETILRDTDFIVELSPPGGVRPFSVIDGGWSNGTAAWPDMEKLAAGIKQRNARPGIWIRPLEAPADAPRGLLLPGTRFGERKDRARELAYDPTMPEARERISAKLRQAAGWNYEMVKHDFSTYDLLGQWGFEMGPQPSLPGWSLHDRSRTNAEVIAELYGLIREGAGEHMLLDGCNTVGHLGQGVFDLQRTGDDTSGHQWERTRRMGVNTLAFRLPQHGSFFTVDADVVGLTEAVPWEFNRQWLDVLARSGTATLVSAGPSARGREQRAALREAFEIAAKGGVGAKPVDWMTTTAPERWRQDGSSGAGSERQYHWSGLNGASPFLSP